MPKKLTVEDYYVTKDGEVFSPYRKIKPGIASNGYLTFNAGSDRTYLVHRLVAERYLPNPENKRTVNHKDGNKLNNQVDNLEWATDSENLKHAFNELQRKPSRGRATISEETVLTIKALLKDGLPHQRLAEFFGVKRSLIADISAKRAWDHINFDQWEEDKIV